MSLQLNYCSPNLTIYVKCSQSLKKLPFILMVKCKLNLFKNSHWPWTSFGWAVGCLSLHYILLSKGEVLHRLYFCLWIIILHTVKSVQLPPLYLGENKILPPRGWQIHRMIAKKAFILCVVNTIIVFNSHHFRASSCTCTE